MVHLVRSLESERDRLQVPMGGRGGAHEIYQTYETTDCR